MKRLPSLRTFISYQYLTGYLKSRFSSTLSKTRMTDVGKPFIGDFRFLEATSLGFMSQIGQDIIVDFLFAGKSLPLTFVDVGAHNGVDISNTYRLEVERGWKGICIEANPKLLESLRRNRACIVENCAIGQFKGNAEFLEISGYAEMLSGLTKFYDKRHLKRVFKEVNIHGGTINKCWIPVRPLQDVLDSHQITVVDFLSIDVEGSEFEVLTSIDLDRTLIGLIAVENNYRSLKLHRFLVKHGFLRLLTVGSDDFYLNPKYVQHYCVSQAI